MKVTIKFFDLHSAACPASNADNAPGSSGERLQRAFSVMVSCLMLLAAITRSACLVRLHGMQSHERVFETPSPLDGLISRRHSTLGWSQTVERESVVSTQWQSLSQALHCGVPGLPVSSSRLKCMLGVSLSRAAGNHSLDP